MFNKGGKIRISIHKYSWLRLPIVLFVYFQIFVIQQSFFPLDQNLRPHAAEGTVWEKIVFDF